MFGASAYSTLCEVLVQVQLQSAAAEAKHFAGLGQQAAVRQDVLPHRIGQQ